MNYRMLELIAPPETAQKAREVAKEKDVLGCWMDNLDDGNSILRVLIDMDRTENLSDTLTEQFSDAEGFRIMLYSIEATVPQPDIEEQEEKKEEQNESEEEPVVGRISREELYADITSDSELNWVYLAMVVLSALVAGVGLMRNDVAVIIGAMVIAPLLGPNVSMALAATLGDLDVGWRSVKANAAGLGTALAVAFGMGLELHVDPQTAQIHNRTLLSLGDITIAMAAGSAGVLAFTRGVPATIVGVMVAVALLPPLVNVGLLLGSGYSAMAARSAILTLTNLICLNLAAILTFLLQGVRPRTWWEAKNAKKATRVALSVWFILLTILAVIIWFWGK